MMLLSTEFDSNLLSIKNKLKYSDDFTFIPIKYNKSDLIIQTPKLYTKYGINNNFKNKQIELLFTNIENDDSIKDLIKLLDNIYLKINNKYKGSHFLKNKNSEKYLKLKVSDNCIIYDERKNKVLTINNNTYGSYIIYLYGVWIRNNVISYHWNLLQAKIYLPLYLNYYSFIEDNTIIIPCPPSNLQSRSQLPPPPPPPLPPM